MKTLVTAVYFQTAGDQSAEADDPADDQLLLEDLLLGNAGWSGEKPAIVDQAEPNEVDKGKRETSDASLVSRAYLAVEIIVLVLVDLEIKDQKQRQHDVVVESDHAHDDREKLVTREYGVDHEEFV